MIPATWMLWLWVPITLVIFSQFAVRRAILISYLTGWMFLPQAMIAMPGLPDLTKMSVTAIGVLLGVCWRDFSRMSAYQFRWFDVPVLAWCLAAPIAASVLNGLGLYDGLSEALRSTLLWAVPYFIGRQYFNDRQGVRDLAIALFVGGLIYMPLCWFEMRFSPQLHNKVYGYHAHSFAQTKRGDGFRPTVFMEHGLMVSLWMASASLVGIWLWVTGIVKKIWHIPMQYAVPVLVLTTALGKSMNSLLLMIAGSATLILSKYIPMRILAIALVAAAPIYCVVRITGSWGGDAAITMTQMIAPDRVLSLQFRFDNEMMLMDRAMERPIFGWGGQNRMAVRDDDGKIISVTDGLWIIALGQRGMFGLIALLGTILVPAVLALQRPATDWVKQEYAPTIALGMVMIIFMIDNLPNGMENPVYMMCGGAVAAYATRTLYYRPKRKAVAMPLYEEQQNTES